MRRCFQILRWLTFLSILAGLGTVLYFIVPPRPRWTVNVADLDWHAVGDGQFVPLKTHADQFELRETKDGAIVFSCPALPKERPYGADYDGRFLTLINGIRGRTIDTTTGKGHSFALADDSDRDDHFWQSAVLSPDRHYLLHQPEFTTRLIDMHADEVIRNAKTGRRFGDGCFCGFTADQRCYYFCEAQDLTNGFHSQGLHAYDLVKKSETLVVPNTRSGRISPDGKLGLVSHADEKNSLWDLATLKKLREIESMNHYAEHAQFSPDNKFLVSWHEWRDGEKAKEEKKDEKAAAETREQADEKERDREAARVSRMTFWDVATGRLLSQTDIPTPNLPCGGWSFGNFSPDSKSFLFYNAACKTIGLWDIASGKEIWQKPIPSAKAQRHMNFSDDGRYLVLCGHDDIVAGTFVWGGLWLLDAKTGEPVLSRPWVTLSPMGMRQESRVARGNRVTYYELHGGAPFPLNHFKQWLNEITARGHWGDYELVICDIPTGVPVAQLPGCSYAHLSEDGQSVWAVEYMTTKEGPSFLHLTCWDLPTPHRWEVIAGVPLGVAALVLLWRKWRRKKLPAMV